MKLYIDVVKEVKCDQLYIVLFQNKVSQTHLRFDLSHCFYRSGKPEMPRNVQIIALYNTIIVTWQTSHNGGTQQTLFIEYKKYFELEWKSVPIENKTSTTIEGLQMDTVYAVRMFSKTSVGDSNKTGEVIVKTGNFLLN